MPIILPSRKYITDNFMLRPGGTGSTNDLLLAHTGWILTNFYTLVSGWDGNFEDETYYYNEENRIPSVDEITSSGQPDNGCRIFRLWNIADVDTYVTCIECGDAGPASPKKLLKSATVEWCLELSPAPEDVFNYTTTIEQLAGDCGDIE